MSIAFADLTVPVDRSPTAQRGIDVAIALARTGTRLHFCSVVDAGSIVGGDEMWVAFDPAPIVDALASEAREVCDRAVEAARRSGVAADGTVLYGAVVPAIADYVTGHHSDAVVIGTHARRGASRVLFGSIAEDLMQTSDVPVVIAHPDDDIASDGPIAVALDGSASSTHALRAAIELARAQARALALITVVEADRAHWNAATLVLDDAADVVRAAGIAFESATLTGRPADAIVAEARRLGTPLVVVGTRGHSGTARLLLGSVAAAIVERAHVPVMVVRHR